MPLLVILDASLSMMRPLTSCPAALDPASVETRRSVAQTCLCSLFDYVAASDRMEFCALVSYSSLYKLLVPFTRDHSELKKAFQSADTCMYDKTLLDSVLAAMNNFVMEEWGSNTPIKVLLVTDGNPGIGPGSLRQIILEMGHRADQSKNLLPFLFPSELHVLLISSQSELNQNNALSLYQRLVDENGHGQVHTPGEGALTVKSVQNMFLKFADSQYSVFNTTLHCGNLNSEVQLFPRPKTAVCETDTEVLTREVSSDLQVCGFLDMADIVSPPAISRHLVLPINPKEKNEGATETKDAGEKSEDESNQTANEGKTPSFSVLLHGSLKVNSMVALVQVAEDWYGILYSWADSKKKSNMMLSIFEPGSQTISWLGKFNLLGPCLAFDQNPYGEEDNKTPFPVRPESKRSYAQNPVVWIKTGSLQSDVQKILRYARKLPDKTQVFYKELNRLRRAALSFGMQDFLEGISSLLERECTLLPGSAHPDAALQLTHAAKLVTNSVYKDYEYNIVPLSTNFSGNS